MKKCKVCTDILPPYHRIDGVLTNVCDICFKNLSEFYEKKYNKKKELGWYMKWRQDRKLSTDQKVDKRQRSDL